MRKWCLLVGLTVFNMALAEGASEDAQVAQTLAQVHSLQNSPAGNSSVISSPLNPPQKINKGNFLDGTVPPPPMNNNLQPSGVNDAASAPSANPFGLPEALPPANPSMQPTNNLQRTNNLPPPVDVGEAAFANVANNMLPLSTDQIHRLKQMFTATQAATAAPAGIPPRPKASSQFVSLAPGATPPVVRLAQGFVTSVVFLDSTGAPWPLEAYDIGDPTSFNISWNKKDNTLMIQSMTLYNYGNLAVRLQGLNTPVMLTLIPGQSAVDYRVDMRVQGTGPNAKPMTGDGLPGTENSELLSVLDGVPPVGARSLDVSGGEAQVWLAGDRMYVRTLHTVLSPGWISTLSSADGTNAYLMQKAPLLLISAHGKVMQLKVQGF